MKINLPKTLFALLLMLSISCAKEKIGVLPKVNSTADSVGFKAQIIQENLTKKNWQTSSANSGAAPPISGIDYFAIRGGINPDELTLMSFGKFTDDTSKLPGRLTIFLHSVTKTGIYKIDGINSSNTVLSILNNNNLEYYSSDQKNNGFVDITEYDTTNSTVSGSFEFQLVFGSKKIKVANGNFTDVPFKQ